MSEKPTPAQIRTVKKLLARMGANKATITTIISYKIASGEWDKNKIEKTIIPKLKKFIELEDVLSDSQKQAYLFKIIAHDLTIFRKIVTGRNLFSPPDKDKNNQQ